MQTTIQVSSETLSLLKQLKEQLATKTYEETIKKLVTKQVMKESMAGSLAKYYKGKSKKQILEGLRDETNRF